MDTPCAGASQSFVYAGNQQMQVLGLVLGCVLCITACGSDRAPADMASNSASSDGATTGTAGTNTTRSNAVTAATPRPQLAARPVAVKLGSTFEVRVRFRHQLPPNADGTGARAEFSLGASTTDHAPVRMRGSHGFCYRQTLYNDLGNAALRRAHAGSTLTLRITVHGQPPTRRRRVKLAADKLAVPPRCALSFAERYPRQLHRRGYRFVKSPIIVRMDVSGQASDVSVYFRMNGRLPKGSYATVDSQPPARRALTPFVPKNDRCYRQDAGGTMRSPWMDVPLGTSATFALHIHGVAKALKAIAPLTAPLPIEKNANGIGNEGLAYERKLHCLRAGKAR